MDSKTKGTFTVFGVFVILAAVVFVFLGAGISQSIISSSTNSELKEEEMKNDISATPEEEQNIIPISDMNCNELRDFILTFEKGWGKAMVEFGNKCKINE